MPSTFVNKVIGLENIPNSTAAEDFVKEVSQKTINAAAVTGTVAVAEFPVYVAKHACRITKLEFIGTAAVTGSAGHYLSVIVNKRTAASTYTATTALGSYVADTATTDDTVAFAPFSFGAGTIYGSTTLTDFDLLKGDELTVKATKTGTNGMSLPISELRITSELKD